MEHPRTYYVEGTLSFDVDDGESPEEVFRTIMRAFYKGAGSSIGPGVFFGPESKEEIHPVED